MSSTQTLLDGDSATAGIRRTLAFFLYEHNRISAFKAAELGGIAPRELADPDTESGIPAYADDPRVEGELLAVLRRILAQPLKETPLLPSQEEAVAIANTAKSDRAIYDQMAEKEAAHWGRVLPNKQQQQQENLNVLDEERRAGFHLGLNRHAVNFMPWVQSQGLTFDHALSLGCGAGRLEREWLNKGIVRSFHGVDIAEDALASARAMAAEEGLACTYSQGDLNFVELPADTYDLIVASTSLHHCLFLEDVADRMKTALKPGGLVWLNDFIGDSQFQYPDRLIELTTALLKTIPQQYTYNRLQQKQIQPPKRPKLPLKSPFESIRSQEIPKVFLERFEVVEKSETHSFIRYIAPVGCLCKYLESKAGTALYDLLMTLDEFFIEQGSMTPTAGHYILKKP